MVQARAPDGALGSTWPRKTVCGTDAALTQAGMKKIVNVLADG